MLCTFHSTAVIIDCGRKIDVRTRKKHYVNQVIYVLRQYDLLYKSAPIPSIVLLLFHYQGIRLIYSIFIKVFLILIFWRTLYWYRECKYYTHTPISPLVALEGNQLLFGNAAKVIQFLLLFERKSDLFCYKITSTCEPLAVYY